MNRITSRTPCGSDGEIYTALFVGDHDVNKHINSTNDARIRYVKEEEEKNIKMKISEQLIMSNRIHAKKLIRNRETIKLTFCIGTNAISGVIIFAISFSFIGAQIP